MNRLFSSAIKNLDSEQSENQTQKSKLYSEQLTQTVQRVPYFGKVVPKDQTNYQSSNSRMRAFSPDNNNTSNNNLSQKNSYHSPEVKNKQEKIINLKQQGPAKMDAKSMKIKKLSIIRSQIKENDGVCISDLQKFRKDKTLNNQNQQRNNSENQNLQILKDTNSKNLLSQHIIFVRNVNKQANELNFKKILENYNVLDIKLQKGTAEITVQGLQDAQNAVQILNQSQISGQNLKAVLQEEVNKGLSHNKQQKQSKSRVLNIK